MAQGPTNDGASRAAAGGGAPAGRDAAPARDHHELALPFGADAPALARAFVLGLTGSVSDDTGTDAVLLTSELVANAVRYGRPPIVLGMTVRHGWLRVEVGDLGTVLPREHDRPPPTDTGGRGLNIVQSVASVWGVSPRPAGPGKTVWFELDDGHTPQDAA